MTSCIKIYEWESREIRRMLQRAEELKRKSKHPSILSTPSLDILLLLADDREFSNQLYWSLNLSGEELEDAKFTAAPVSLSTRTPMSARERYRSLMLRVAKKHAIHNAPGYVPNAPELSYLNEVKINTKLNRADYHRQLQTIAGVEPLRGVTGIQKYNNAKLPYCSPENEFITEIHCLTLCEAVQTLFDTSIVHKALCVTEPEGLRTWRSSVTGSIDCLATLIAHIPIKTSRHVYEVAFGVKRHTDHHDLMRAQWRFTLTVTELAYAYVHPLAERQSNFACVRQKRNILSMHWRTISELARSLEATSYGLNNPDPSTLVPDQELTYRDNHGSLAYRDNHGARHINYTATNWWNLILDSAPDKNCHRTEYLRLCESLIYKLYD